MSAKLMWGGLTMIVALPVFLKILSVSGADTFALVGAVAMVVGAVMFALDK